MRLAHSGEIWLNGSEIRKLGPVELRQARREMQMVFQDPFASLDPRMRVGEIVAEPLAIHEPRLSSAGSRNINVIHSPPSRSRPIAQLPMEA